MDASDELEALRREVRALRDLEEIRACLLRYARGVDRLDEDLILSAFHDDAIDIHGPVTFTPREFLAWYRSRQEGREIGQHILTNVTTDVDGDVAHCETYYVAISRAVGAADVELFGGRYIDRLDRRDGAWRIAVRVMVPEWRKSADAVDWSTLTAGAYLGSRSRADASYHRPLTDVR
jgi:hypothetical protein